MEGIAVMLVLAIVVAAIVETIEKWRAK